MAAAILLVAIIRRLHTERLLLTKADGIQAVSRDAEGDEVLLGGTGAAIAQSQVVFGGAALVAMTFDGDFNLRIVAKEIRGAGQRGAGVGANVGFVEIEVGVFHLAQEERVWTQLSFG